MKKNVKILAWALITAITVTSVWMTFANEETWNWFFNKVKQRVELNTEQNAEMDAIKSIFEKQKNGEVLTTDEQLKYDEFKTNNIKIWKEWKGKWMWKSNKGWFMNNLTTEEKTALESMTTEEKIAFFEAKKLEMKAKRDAHENVIDKLLAWEDLTADEEIVRAEIVKERAERKAKMQANIE